MKTFRLSSFIKTRFGSAGACPRVILFAQLRTQHWEIRLVITGLGIKSAERLAQHCAAFKLQ